MKRLKYFWFCIRYPLKRWLRKRWEKARDDGWDGYRKAESEEWAETIVHRMSSPEGDIFQAVQKEKETRGKLVGHMKDGDDIFGVYKSD